MYRPTIVAIAALFLCTTGCGPMQGDEPGNDPAGKGDGPGGLGNTSNAYFAAGIESNLPVAPASKLHRVLQQNWVEDHKSHWYSAAVEDKELKQVFGGDAELAREFSDLLSGKRWSELKRVYQALREVLHNPAALGQFEDLVAMGAYRQLYESYVPQRPQLLPRAEETNRGKPAGLPTIVLNIPAEWIQVFYRNERYQNNQVVVGHPEYEGYDLNSKTRVGDHTISSWHYCYQDGAGEYPRWCDNQMKGAFGKWTAKLDRSYQYIHGTIGGDFIGWFAIKMAAGSHGCVRNKNGDIERIHEIAPEGSWVRKIYARHERTMSIKNIRFEEDNGNNKDTDPFDQDLVVSFRHTKHGNIYDYHGGSGVYYPQTGVAVDYAHPTDAMTSTVSGSSSSGNQCTAMGGSCIDVNVTQCGSTPKRGFCPGAANIQCCVP